MTALRRGAQLLHADFSLLILRKAAEGLISCSVADSCCGRLQLRQITDELMRSPLTYRLWLRDQF